MAEQRFTDLVEVNVEIEEMDGFNPGETVETPVGEGTVIGAAEITQKRYTFNANMGPTRRVAVATKNDTMYFDSRELNHKQTAKTRPLSEYLG